MSNIKTNADRSQEICNLFISLRLSNTLFWIVGNLRKETRFCGEFFLSSWIIPNACTYTHRGRKKIVDKSFWTHRMAILFQYLLSCLLWQRRNVAKDYDSDISYTKVNNHLVWNYRSITDNYSNKIRYSWLKN